MFSQASQNIFSAGDIVQREAHIPQFCEWIQQFGVDRFISLLPDFTSIIKLSSDEQLIAVAIPVFFKFPNYENFVEEFLGVTVRCIRPPGLKVLRGICKKNPNIYRQLEDVFTLSEVGFLSPAAVTVKESIAANQNLKKNGDKSASNLASQRLDFIKKNIISRAK